MLCELRKFLEELPAGSISDEDYRRAKEHLDHIDKVAKRIVRRANMAVQMGANIPLMSDFIRDAEDIEGEDDGINWTGR